jgi:hypothetical protein
MNRLGEMIWQTIPETLRIVGDEFSLMLPG